MQLLKKTAFLFALVACLSIVVFQAYPVLWLLILGDAIRGISDVDHRERVCRWAMRCSDRVIRLFGKLMKCRITFRLPQHREPAVVVVNHRSTFDILLMLAALGRMGYTKVRFVAKSGVAALPVIGRAAKEMGCAFIGRQGDAAAIKAIRSCAVASFLDGACLIIFPEGTTFHNPAFVSSRVGEYRHVLPPKASGLKAVLSVLTDWPVFSMTLDWGDVVGADTIGGMAPLYGKYITIDGEYVVGPGDEPVEEWVNREWKRKDEKIETMHRALNF